MEIEVKGHSGCQIDIVREDKDLFVYKSTRDIKYLSRLKLQATKQQEAFKWAEKDMRIPKIYVVNEKPGFVSIKMEYVYSKNFVEFFESVGFEQINYFILSLIDFLEEEIEKSLMQTVEKFILIDKFEDVYSKTANNKLVGNNPDVLSIFDKSRRIFNSIESIEIPVGCCHGDLTFSNILFSGSKYYLIDFLDSFIESPITDIVKLRQDTVYMWSELMYTGQLDSIRLKIVCDKIDGELDTYFRKYDWYNKYYAPFQLMNFLRIIQYVKEENVADYLIHTLNRMLNEF